MQFIVALGAATLTVLFAATSLAPAAVQLRPDLRTLKPSDLKLRQDSNELLLRFSNEVANAGRGPLELRPDSAYTDCDGDGNADDHFVSQRVYEDGDGNGYYDSGDATYTDTQVGCRIYHDEHHHWHFNDFASYILRRESGGQVVASSTKVSFCVLDEFRPYASLPGSPRKAVYPPACGEFAAQGISVGWSDEYDYTVPGQSLDVTGLPAAKYCLVSEADPLNHLIETNDGNNTATRRLKLHPHAQHVDPLGGHCRG